MWVQVRVDLEPQSLDFVAVRATVDCKSRCPQKFAQVQVLAKGKMLTPVC